MIPTGRIQAASNADDLAFHAIVERAPGEWAFRSGRAVLSLDGDGAGNLLDLAAGAVPSARPGGAAARPRRTATAT